MNVNQRLISIQDHLLEQGNTYTREATDAAINIFAHVIEQHARDLAASVHLNQQETEDNIKALALELIRYINKHTVLDIA